MGGLRGEGAQITTKSSLQKNVLKGSQGGALPPPRVRDRRSLSKKGGERFAALCKMVCFAMLLNEFALDLGLLRGTPLTFNGAIKLQKIRRF
jgi:hypothetical protein